MCVALTPVPVAPSPKVQAYETMLPSGSLDPLPLNATWRGAVPLVGLAEATATGGWLGIGSATGSTNNVTLCAGTVALRLEPLTVKSARRVMAFAEVSCQTCAEPFGVN